MTEKAQYSTAPADLNELKRRIEERGTNWNDALARLKEATGGKDIAAAMRDGWALEDFWKALTSEDERLARTVAKYQDAGPIEGMAYVPPSTPTPAPQNGFTEAPASFNVKAISPAGFDIMLTLRDSDSRQLMTRALGALDWLVKKGFTPTSARSGGNSGRNGPGAGNGDKPKYCTHKSDGPGFCPAHGKELKQSKHHPGYYCPTKL